MISIAMFIVRSDRRCLTIFFWKLVPSYDIVYCLKLSSVFDSFFFFSFWNWSSDSVIPTRPHHPRLVPVPYPRLAVHVLCTLHWNVQIAHIITY